MALLALRLSLALALVAFVAGGCDGADEGSEGTEADPEPIPPATRSCDYRDERQLKPGPENRVRVGGGATCEEASDLFFHPAPNSEGEYGAISPKPLPDWVCEQQKKARYGPVAFDCTNGSKRVRFLFH